MAKKEPGPKEQLATLNSAEIWSKVNKAVGRSIGERSGPGAVNSRKLQESIRYEMQAQLDAADETAPRLGRWVSLDAVAEAVGVSAKELLSDPDKIPTTLALGEIEGPSVPLGVTVATERDGNLDHEREKALFLESVDAIVAEPSDDSGDTVAASGDDTATDSPDAGDTEAAASSDGGTSAYADIAKRMVQETHSGVAADKATAGSPDSALARQLKPGPADTTAIHDYHSIRIAFPGMWTHVADPKLRGELEELIRGIVEIENNHEWLPSHVTESIEQSEILELDQLIALAEEAIPVAEVTTAPPPDIALWKPELVAVWDLLSLQQHGLVIALYWLRSTLLPFLQSYEHYLGDKVAQRLEEFYDRGKRKLSFDIRGGEVPINFPDVPVPPQAEPFLAWSVGVAYNADNFANEVVGRIVEDAEAQRNASAAEKSAAISTSMSRLKELLTSVKKKKLQNYGFDVFTPRSYNFGIIVSYRQRWMNDGYQVGDLVSTIPLAPGEKRTIEITRKETSKRFEKEIQKAMSSRKEESENRSRAENEIVKKAKTMSDFGFSAESSIGLPLDLGDFTTSAKFNTSSSQESSQLKKNLRESVRKAASEYRSERTIEVQSEATFDSGYSESSVIENTNNEITVTYLLYELQQQFRVSEKLHQVQPVVLVAFDVPKPDEVTEDWILENAWILRRALLDDSFNDAIDYISTTFAGDELAVEILRRQWQANIKIVESLRGDLAMQVSVQDRARAAIATSQNSGGDVNLWLAIESLLGDDVTEANAEGKREAAQLLLDWVEDDVNRSRQSTREAVSALLSATDKYISAVRERLNRRVAIDQFILHVQQNIIYYMKAIWSHEPTDQRFLRLYDLPIVAPKIGGECVVESNTIRSNLELVEDGTFAERHYIRVRCPAPTEFQREKTLNEVADLSRLLGFKGNYAIFPLLEGNGLSEFMMQDYLHEYYGVYDPDPTVEGPTLDHLRELAGALDLGTHSTVDDLRVTAESERVAKARENAKKIKDLVKKIKPPQDQQIVVPTGSLFIEALPGTNALLEDFKLRHRAEDVRKARLEGDLVALENLRRAARLDASDLGDPEIDKQVRVIGSSDVDVDV